MRAIIALWQREVIRFYRQPSRVVGAILSPFLFWFLIGSGMGRSVSIGSQNYLEYFFPGALLLVVFFTAIFSMISIIEDRKEGVLQGVEISPASGLAIVLGKILGSTTLSLIQGIIFLLLVLMALQFSLLEFLGTALSLLLNAFLFSAIGFFMAWRFKSIQGFHAVMNIILMPMWFLSGALFPEEGAAVWIQWIMMANPLKYGLSLMKSTLGIAPFQFIDLFVVLGASILFIGICFWAVKKVKVMQ